MQDGDPADWESMRRMSMGYGASFTLGIVALPFAGTVLGGLKLLRSGGNPIDALDGTGLICFILAYGPVFLIRLVLWKRSPPRLRAAVRTFLTIVECLVAAAGIIAMALVIGTPDAPGSLVWFALCGLFCSGMGLLWVFRYRDEL